MKTVTALGVVLAWILSVHGASASTIMLGDQDFTDGAFPTLGQYADASSDDPAPFNLFCGSDPSGPSCSTGWTFGFSSTAVSGASLTVGLYDHDSAAPGDQVFLFTVGGIDLTAALNALLNSSGGTQSEYNVYTLALPATVFSAFLAGSLDVALTFQGPGLGACDSPAEGLCPSNGVGPDFSTLDFDGSTVPEPATLLLLGTGLAAAGVKRRLRKRT
jgi:hypothetical protein